MADITSTCRSTSVSQPVLFGILDLWFIYIRSSFDFSLATNMFIRSLTAPGTLPSDRRANEIVRIRCHVNTIVAQTPVQSSTHTLQITEYPAVKGADLALSYRPSMLAD